MPFETPGKTAPKEFKDPPSSHHYRLNDGSFCPSVTTVLGCLAKGDGLMEWSNSLGFKGLRYKEHLDSLARTGTLAHAKIEADLRGTAAPDETGYTEEEQRGAFASHFHFRAWRRTHEVRALALERVFVSEALRVGGTVDAILEVDSQPIIVDFKTSAKPYLSHFLQLAAYQALVRETMGHNLPVMVLCLPRVGGGYTEALVQPDERLGAYLDTFLAAKRLYDSLQQHPEH